MVLRSFCTQCTLARHDSPNPIPTPETTPQFGQPVLLENVGEELDPALEPLLAKQVRKASRQVRQIEQSIKPAATLPPILRDSPPKPAPTRPPKPALQLFKQGGVTCIRLGDAIVEYSADFRLYVTTRLANPHYLPEVAVKVGSTGRALTLSRLAVA